MYDNAVVSIYICREPREKTMIIVLDFNFLRNHHGDSIQNYICKNKETRKIQKNKKVHFFLRGASTYGNVLTKTASLRGASAYGSVSAKTALQREASTEARDETKEKIDKQRSENTRKKR